jgi:hypothetical protein
MRLRNIDHCARVWPIRNVHALFLKNKVSFITDLLRERTRCYQKLSSVRRRRIRHYQASDLPLNAEWCPSRSKQTDGVLAELKRGRLLAGPIARASRGFHLVAAIAVMLFVALDLRAAVLQRQAGLGPELRT